MDESLTNNYIQALCELHEDDFSKKILKPLFESMGYERVDFNGGPYERGRDLIAQRKIPPRKEMYLVYIQSKKIGNIQNTSTAAKLSTLLHQLRQCCTGELNDIDGEKIKPNEVYLACPEQISNRLTEEIGSQLSNMPISISFYDGPKIISDIQTYCPELLKRLTNIKNALTTKTNIEWNNQELLSALKSSSTPKLDNFYSDLSFFVGSFDSNLLLHLEISFKSLNFNISEQNWKSTKYELEALSKIHGLNLVDGKLKDIEISFEKHKRKYESKKNKDLKTNLKTLESNNKEILLKLETKSKTLAISLDRNSKKFNNNLSDIELEEKQALLDYLKTHISCSPAHKKPSINEKSINYLDAQDYYSLIDEYNLNEKNKLNIKSKIVKKPYYNLKINHKSLNDNLESLKRNYFKGIKLINNRELNAAGLKSFLQETQNTLSLISRLKNELFPLELNIKHPKDNVNVDRVSISPHDIFSTGHDIAVYGGAGAGKTTTLISYANQVLNHNNITLIYIPLNKLVDKLKQIIQSIDIKDINNDLLIKIILLSKGLDFTDKNIGEAKNVLSSKLVLILDALDEVYNTLPNIIPAIKEFKINFPNTQFIISSRDCVSYLDNIDFLGITLLPFTHNQLNKFIKGWFNDTDKSEPLIQSIKKGRLYEYIKTPLLATITCALVEKGINAPSSEKEIYAERLRLLTGEYDLHKNIERQAQSGDLLRKCAIKIAFGMLLDGVRSLPKNRIIKLLNNYMSHYHSPDLLTSCVEELINPCNVLIFEPITKTYSFGHFRFQEHLGSEELKLNRNIDLSELVIKDWWRGTLCLYAQDNDISYLFEDTYRRYGNIKNAKITFKAMIENSPKKNKSSLNDLFAKYEKADLMDDLILDYDYDYNIYD